MFKKQKNELKKLEKNIEKQEPKAGIGFLVIGILMIALGIYTWFHPVATLIALALYLGVVFIVVGLGYLILAFHIDSGWYLALGLLDVLVGILFVSNLGVTAESLPIIFALWTLFVGVLQVSEAFYRKRIDYPWGLELISGFIGILFSMLIMTNPMIGAITITILMGSYIILYGILGLLEYSYIKKYN